MTFQTLGSLGVQFSDEFIDLCNRRRDLGAIIPETRDDMLALSAMWQALADDFAEESHNVNAGMCQKKANHWAGKANGY